MQDHELLQLACEIQHLHRSGADDERLAELQRLYDSVCRHRKNKM